MRSRTRKASVFAAVMALMAVAAFPQPVGANGGFSGPIFGLATAPNGDILVADAGAGIVSLDDGSTIALPGITALSPIGRSSIWATVSGEPGEPFSQALVRVSHGRTRNIADLGAFEAAHNPDGSEVDSNPYDVERLSGRRALVVDAGGNDLLRVNRRGAVNVLAIFPPEEVSTANLQGLVGCPEANVPDFAFICEVPAMEAEAVPTSVAVGRDGYYYVGELKGFPAPAGESNIWRVSPRASSAVCGQSPDCVKVFDGGFTSIIDLAFGPDGRLYVAELDEASWAAVEIFEDPSAGGTVNACDVRTLVCEEVATGIPILSAITFGKDGALWATQNALIPPIAEVIQLS